MQIVDTRADPDYEVPDTQMIAKMRTVLSVPLLREGIPVGVITLWKNKVAPFTERQIDLVTTFADQAVIAIENVRLFEELRQRTGDLSEALERQTATSEVLQVISTSPGELEPVFQSMLEHATRICEAKFTALWAFEDGAARIISSLGIPPKFAAFLQRGAHRPGPSTRSVVSSRRGRSCTFTTIAPINPISPAIALRSPGSNWAASGRC